MYLYERLHDKKYLDAALLSANFIKAHLYDGTIIRDFFDTGKCKTMGLELTYNSGYFIEGLSVYVDMTHDPEWTTL